MAAIGGTDCLLGDSSLDLCGLCVPSFQNDTSCTNGRLNSTSSLVPHVIESELLSLWLPLLEQRYVNSGTGGGVNDVEDCNLSLAR